MTTPLLGDLPSTKTRYEAGDRVVAKVRTQLSHEQRNRLYRQLCKFCGADVNLLIVNTAVMGLLRTRPDDRLCIAGIQSNTQESSLGVANVDLAKVDFQLGDRLFVAMTMKLDPLQKLDIKGAIQRWCGDDVEVILGHPSDLDFMGF
jgi:hypothetical protein